MRVLLDANIFLSYLLSPDSKSTIVDVLEAGLLGRYQLLVTPLVIEEFVRKVETKRYLSERIPRTMLAEFVGILGEGAEAIPPLTEAIPAVTRDPKDDYLLAYALLGRANYLVTGDDDLRSLGTVGDLQIVTARQFWQHLQDSTL